MRGLLVVALWFGLAWLVTELIAEAVQPGQARRQDAAAWVEPPAGNELNGATRIRTKPPTGNGGANGSE
jgi:hypothetical protein